MSTDVSQTGIQNLNTPQQFSEIQTKILKTGEIGVYYGILTDQETEKIKMLMKIISGFPIMYIDSCQTFPYCSYTDNFSKIRKKFK